MAIPAAREPGPLVTLVRKRTVAKVDNDRVRGTQMHPMLGRILVELQQHVGVVGDLCDRLGVLRAVVDGERLDRHLGLVDVLGVVYSRIAASAPECADFGSAARTLACFCHQQRCSRVLGNTSRSAFQNPSALSPTASIGAVIPRRRQPRSRSAHDSVDSR
jgi:hypothetical protein